jgi:aminoglycoside 6-adenylyltransferase
MTLPDYANARHQAQYALVEWVNSRPDIRAVLLIGSTVRRDHPADVLSDLDTLIYTTDLQHYRQNSTWQDVFGPLWLTLTFPEPESIEYLCVLNGGFKVDLMFQPLELLLRLPERDPGVFTRGYQILVDKDGMAAQLPASPFTNVVPPQPSEAQFTATVERFFYSVYTEAKWLWRGNLWTVKWSHTLLNMDLITILEWHTAVLYGRDVWHRGRNMHEWLDPELYSALHGTFAHFDTADSWHALDRSIALFRHAAKDVAAKLNYTYPVALDEQICSYMSSLQAASRD